MKGKIIKWDDDKGFGFILSADDSKNIFVHIKSFKDRNVRPEINQNVTFTIQNDTNGKVSAINVSRPTDNPLKNRLDRDNVKNILKHRQHNTNSIPITEKSTQLPIFYILIILSYVLFLFHFTFKEGKLPPYITIIYIFMGIITYFSYYTDKLNAIKSERRVSEKTLLTLSLLGGWIGALIAQHKFRHKTQKMSFQISFWTTVFFNILLLSSTFRIIHF